MNFATACRFIIAFFMLAEVEEHCHWSIFVALTYWAVQWELFIWSLAHQQKKEMERQRMVRDAIDRVAHEIGASDVINVEVAEAEEKDDDGKAEQ